MVFYSFVTKILVDVATIWHGFYFWKCTLTWIEIESKPPELRLMYFKKQDRGSYWSVPVWLSALFVKPHAKSVFKKLALNTDLSSSRSKFFLWGKWFCCSLQQRNSCTSATWTYTDSSTKIDKCIHERVLAVTLASCAIIYPVTDHPSRFLQKTEQSTSLLGFQGGNREHQGTQMSFSFPSVTEKHVHIP